MSFWCLRCKEQSRTPSHSAWSGIGSEYLNLEMLGRVQVPLHVDVGRTEVRLRLTTCRVEGRLELAGRGDYLQTAAPAPARGLDRDRVSMLGRELGRNARVGDWIGYARDHGNPGFGREPARLDLVPHRARRVRRRPDPLQSRVEHGLREVGVLGQEPVARVDRFGAGATSRIEQGLDVEIGVDRSDAGQRDPLVGQLDMSRARIDVRVNSDRLDAQLLACADRRARLSRPGSRSGPA